ncbi:MAG: hypothetical protein ACI8V5_001004, partial [Limisphaerales bacterium]
MKDDETVLQTRRLYRIHPNSLRAQMINECDAMAKHASASGDPIPGALAEVIEEFKLSHIEIADHATPPETPSQHEHNHTRDYYETINTEIPEEGPLRMERLSRVHQQIAAIVAPATPRTIVLLNKAKESNHWYTFLGDVALIRRLMVATLFFLIAFVCLSLSPDVSEDSGSIFESDGIPLLINLLFLLAAAGMGACFALLFKANKYIVDFSYDPKFESSYWIELIVGLVAGLILSNLIPLAPEFTATAGEAVGGAADAAGAGADPNAGAGAAAAAASPLQAMGRPVLALLGGFSASLVHRILRRLVDTVGSVFQGDAQSDSKVEIERATAQAEEKSRTKNLKTASNLIEIQGVVASGASAAEIQEKVNQLVRKLTE